MISRLSMVAAGIGVAALMVQAATPVRAQTPREAELIGFHELCEKGDRKACVQFGVMLGENRAMHAEWRKRYAHWFWWER